MAIFNSYVCLPEGKSPQIFIFNDVLSPWEPTKQSLRGPCNWHSAAPCQVPGRSSVPPDLRAYRVCAFVSSPITDQCWSSLHCRESWSSWIVSRVSRHKLLPSALPGGMSRMTVFMETLMMASLGGSSNHSSHSHQGSFRPRGTMARSWEVTVAL